MWKLLVLTVALLAYDTLAFSVVSVSPGLSPTINLIGQRSFSREKALVLTSSTTTDGVIEENNESGGTASISNEVFNLVKNVVGAGVLSLPSGISVFGSTPSTVIPAIILISSIGIVSGYCFSLIGRICSFTGAKTYRDAWDKSISSKSSWIAATSCTAKTLLATVAYSMILGDTFQALFKTLGLQVTRSQTILSLTSFVLFPLCLLKDLSSLAPFSLLGIIGMVYTTIAMALRYFTASYKLPAGIFVNDLPTNLMPSFGSVGASGSSSFILICMLSTAYIAHFNAPKYFSELKNNTVKRFNIVTSVSYAISIAFFVSIASFGFLTFGKNCSGLILNNYSTKDLIMTLSRFAVAISILFSYPLAFTGVRDGFLDILQIPTKDRSTKLLNKLTLGILSIVTVVAIKVKDLTFLLSFGGATLGNALIYIFPAFMFRGAVKKMGDKATQGLKNEVVLAMYVALMGLTFGVIGGRMSLLNAFA